MSDRAAWRIASGNGCWSAFGQKGSRSGRTSGPSLHDDLCTIVNEDDRTWQVFAADAPNQLRLVDITEHKTAEGKLYRFALKDACSGEIVGCSIDSRMKSRPAGRALKNAVAMRGDVAGRIIHSDRGSQFRSREFRGALARHLLVGSTGRVGSSGDKAAMESSFAMRENNVLAHRPWSAREQLHIAIVTWSARAYHRRRRQARWGRLTPIEVASIFNTTVALAA